MDKSEVLVLGTSLLLQKYYKNIIFLLQIVKKNKNMISYIAK